MIAILKHGTTESQKEHLVKWLKNMNLDVHISQGTEVTVLGLIGDTSRVDMDLLKSLEMVETVKRVSKPFKQANRKFHPKDTIIEVGNVKLENRENLLFELEFYINSLQAYQSAIQNSDMDALIALLEEGKHRKEEVDG